MCNNYYLHYVYNKNPYINTNLIYYILFFPALNTLLKELLCIEDWLIYVLFKNINLYNILRVH